MSYPFDWIFSSFNIVIDCIENDFVDFLDKKQYIDIGSNSRCGYAKYHASLFNHKNPLKNSEDYFYYERCVNRFRQLIKSQESKFFLIYKGNITNLNYESELKDISDFNQKLKEKTNNYKLVVIIGVINNINLTFKINKINDELDIIIYNSKTKSDGIAYSDNEDNALLNNILLDNYEFDLCD